MINDTSRNNLGVALENYLRSLQWYDTEEDFERLFAGVLAFIWVNLYKEPYHPIYFDQIEEKPRKWWQFWRER
jgi:hypothetical protein